MDERRRGYREYFEEQGRDVLDCSCLDCSDAYICQFAFDPYNTNSDCLASK
jgi:hypothetical protein